MNQIFTLIFCVMLVCTVILIAILIVRYVREKQRARKFRAELIKQNTRFNGYAAATGEKTIDPEEWADATIAMVEGIKAEARSKKLVPFQYHSPIIITPRPRCDVKISKDGTSWFGGLPRLGDHPWPKSRDGSYMHLAAQLDLGEFANMKTPKGFPKSGSLAFFVDVVEWPYNGAVVYIQTPSDTPTQPVEPLPRLFRSTADGEGYTIERHTPDTAPRGFPRWPVRFLPLDVIEDPNDYDVDPVQDALAEHFSKAQKGKSIFTRSFQLDLPEPQTVQTV